MDCFRVCQDKATGREQQCDHTNLGLTPDEIDRPIPRGGMFAEVDKNAKQIVVLRNGSSRCCGTRSSPSPSLRSPVQNDQDIAERVFTEAEAD